jgi:hypothetical protein
MNRLHLFELEDMPWMPRAIRNGITDFLHFAVVRSELYNVFARRLARSIGQLRSARVVDLCSGAGGPWASLHQMIAEGTGRGIQVRLTDYYPNLAAFEALANAHKQVFEFSEQPVSALDVPQDLIGFRTLFSSFHHFSPTQAASILSDAVSKRQSIAIAESTQRHPLLIAYMMLTPLIVLLTTPFQAPFRWSRLFWTYLVPAIPLAVMFDGIVSCLRTYTPNEMMGLVRTVAGHDTYEWQVGIDRLKGLPVGVTFLIGTPRDIPGSEPSATA